jgi:hypothetical protein
MLVPACAGFQPDAAVLRPISATPPPAPVGYRPMPSALATQTAKPRVVEKFAEGRPDSALVLQPPAPVPNPATEKVAGLIPVEHKAASPLAVPVDTPRLVLPAMEASSQPEPRPEAEGVIRPHWPVIKGAGPIPDLPAPSPVESNVVLPPPSELMKSVSGPADPPTPLIPLGKPDEAPATVAPPPALPLGVIGSSVHQSNASPIPVAPVESTRPTEPLMAAAVTGDKPAAADSALLKAIQAFQQNKPDEAVEHLKAYDPATQQILLALMPAMARLSEGKLSTMKPAEADVLLDQLTQVPNLLRSRASLRAENVRLCREVHNFAHVEPFPDRHEFRPGDVVYLYMELANFSCVPDPKGGYTVTLASSLELKDSSGVVVWRADPKEAADHVSTPPQDYYRNFRLCVPGVAPGVYTLTVKTTDRPTGREASKAIEMRVGAR